MIDPTVISCIEKAVSDAGQPESVSKRLCAWLKASSETELTSDQEAQFLETVLESIVVSVSDED